MSITFTFHDFAPFLRWSQEGTKITIPDLCRRTCSNNWNKFSCLEVESFIGWYVIFNQYQKLSNRLLCLRSLLRFWFLIFLCWTFRFRKLLIDLGLRFLLLFYQDLMFSMLIGCFLWIHYIDLHPWRDHISRS